LAVCGQPEPVISECWIAGKQAGAYFISVVSHQSARLSDWRGETQAAKETGPWFVQGHQQWFETILFADTSFMLLGCQSSDFVRFMAGSWGACVHVGRGEERCYWEDSDPCLPWLSSAAFCLVLVNLPVRFFHRHVSSSSRRWSDKW